MGREGTKNVGWTYGGSNQYLHQLEELAQDHWSNSRNKTAKRLLEERLDFVRLGWVIGDTKITNLFAAILASPAILSLAQILTQCDDERINEVVRVLESGRNPRKRRGIS